MTGGMAFQDTLRWPRQLYAKLNSLAGYVQGTDFAPTAQQQLQWPAWGLHTESRGENGEAPELPEAKRLLELFDSWLTASSSSERTAIWQEMLQIHADQVYSIGIINATFQPIVVTNRMHNVPEKGLYTYDPGSYFGIYQPDAFWLDQTETNPS